MGSNTNSSTQQVDDSSGSNQQKGGNINQELSEKETTLRRIACGALEKRRSAWETWLRRCYERVEVIETSEAFAAFAHTNELLPSVSGSSEDATVARAARRRRLVAEAKMANEARSREALKATLRRREAEVAKDIGDLELRGAQLSRRVASLRARRQALREVVEGRISWRESRDEKTEASIAQRRRLREEASAAAKAAAASKQRADEARQRRQAETAAALAKREAAECQVDISSAAVRARRDALVTLEERAARARGRLGQRTAEAHAAQHEAARALEARTDLEAVELPRCEAELEAAINNRKEAELTLAKHKRDASARTARLGLELARRHDEHDAIKDLVKLLDLSDDKEVDRRLDPGYKQFSNEEHKEDQAVERRPTSSTHQAQQHLPQHEEFEEVDVVPHEQSPATQEEIAIDPELIQKSGAKPNIEISPTTLDRAIYSSLSPDTLTSEETRQLEDRRSRLIEAYLVAVRRLEAQLDDTRRVDQAVAQGLERDLEQARSAETALTRVLNACIERRDALRDSSRRAARASASAIVAKQEAANDLERILADENKAKIALEQAENEFSRVSDAAKAIAQHTSAREKSLRHAHDADIHVAARHAAQAASECDALALAEGRVLHLSKGTDVSSASDNDQTLYRAISAPEALNTAPFAPPHLPDVLDIANTELASVENLIEQTDLEKNKVRAHIANINTKWETESVAARAKLHGAECQLRIFKDDALAAQRMQRDITDTVST